jgi:hypothetical protein
MSQKLWIFGDSFAAMHINSPERIWQRQLGRQMSERSGKPVELRVHGLPGSSQDWALQQFVLNADAISEHDRVIFIATTPSRYWYFQDRPALSNWNILDFDEACTEEQARAVELHIKHIQRLELDILQCASRMGLLAYEAHRRGLPPIMILPVVEMLAGDAEDYPDLIWGIGNLSRIQFDEYANPTEALRRNEQGIPGYFLGVDCRYGHLCLRNHDILAEKLLEGLESNTRPDLNKGFHRHFITPEWHKDQALIDSELNLDLVPHFHRMAERNKNYIPWKIRAGIKSIFES